MNGSHTRREPLRWAFLGAGMSMLDVICSALGAFLILFLVAAQTSERERARAETAEDQLQDLGQQARELTDALQRVARQNEELAGELDRAREDLAEAQKDLQRAEKKTRKLMAGAGMAIGMCRTDADAVRVTTFDHGQEDGDRVRVSWNGDVVRADATLTSAHQMTRHALDPGANYYGAAALSEGFSPPNTATVIVDPCRDGAPETFTWNMQTGQKRFVSIVRD